MNERSEKYQLFIVSDSTGDTAERTALAVLSQFKNVHQIEITKFRHVKAESQIREVVQKAGFHQAFILYTIVSEPLRKFLDQEAARVAVPAVDLIGPLLRQLELYLHKLSSAEPGLLHRVDQQYLQRMDAIQFAVKHDDGQSLHTLPYADIILAGPSRSSKTPLSMYLAQYGWKVANIPLVLNIPPPEQIFRVNQEKVVALMTDFDILIKVRQARVKKFNQFSSMNYADPSYILNELNYCNELYKQNSKWKRVFVAGRAVEEVASDILSLLGLQK